MKLEKVKKTYNDYSLELSWGQLEAIAAVLEANHSDPLADELYAEWKWYMEHVPGPGEDEAKWDAQQKASAEASVQGGAEGEAGEEDMPIPMPPGSEAGTPPEGGAEAPYPPEEGAAGGIQQPTPAAIKLGAKPRPEPGLPEPGAEGEPGAMPPEETDERLPEPPRE
jgi:hypothetical protein